MTELIRKSLPLDGIALALHGTAAAEHFDDADAYILERVRQVVGNQTPIVVTFDYHANLSENMVQSASALIGYDTYPHFDMAKRGAESPFASLRSSCPTIPHFVAPFANCPC